MSDFKFSSEAACQVLLTARVIPTNGRDYVTVPSEGFPKRRMPTPSLGGEIAGDLNCAALLALKCFPTPSPAGKPSVRRAVVHVF